jgi:hypothetical protein
MAQYGIHSSIVDRLELLFQSELPSLFIQLLQDELQDEALFVSPSAQRTMTAFLLNAVITGHGKSLPRHQFLIIPY